MFTNIDTPIGDYYRIDPSAYFHLVDHLQGLRDQLCKPKDQIDMKMVMFNLEEALWQFQISLEDEEINRAVGE